MNRSKSKFCKLKYNINAKNTLNHIKIDNDKIIASELILKNTIICVCEPIISYYRPNKLSSKSLLSALNLVPNDEIYQILTNIWDFKMYPLKEEDMLSGLKKLYEGSNPDNISMSELIKQPQHVIQVYLKYNHFNGNNNRYLYLLASKFNHSCNPNCRWEISNGIIEIISLREILPFEECTISYIDIENFHLTNTTIERQDIIMENYDFICKCKECITISIDKCFVCNNINNLLSCSKCKNIYYCGKDCQRLHWSIHKNTCNK
jgi:hypothetical protein